jgi:chloramphenicol 3-O-phosphotransferase
MQKVVVKKLPFLHVSIDLFITHLPDIIFNNALEGVHAKMQFLEKSFNRLDEHGVCEMWITGISVIC